ncbi:MAG: hypothetical protein ABSG21_18160 [Spirochaetia bacterium]|jgi:hypothetical protein
MKKAVVLGMILLALGCMAYADGVTVGFDFGRAQFVLAQANSTTLPTDTMQGWSPLSGTFPNTQRYDMQFAWTNDHVGINMTAYTEPYGQMINKIAQSGIGIDWVNMYATFKLMPDMFSAYLGRFQGDGWDHFRMDSDHPIHDVDNSSVGRFNGWGMILDLMPKDSGFDAAVFLKTLDPTLNGANGGDTTLANQASQYDFAASYTVPDLVKFTAGSTTFGYWPTPQRNVFGRVQVLMVPNLTLWDDFWYRGFDVSPSLTIYSDELAATYNMKPITIVFAGFFQGDNTSGTSVTTWTLYPEVYYNMGAFTLGLYAGLTGNSTSGSGIGYQVEPYVKLNDFGIRVSVHYIGNSASGSNSTWEIPVIVDYGF